MSKKLKVLISLLMAVLVSMFSMVAFASFSADFEDSKLDGWEILGDNAVSVVNNPAGSGKVLKLERLEAIGQAHDANNPVVTQINKRFDTPYKGTVIVEYKAMTTTITQQKVMVINDSTDGVEGSTPQVIRIAFQNAELRLLRPAGTPAVVLMPIEANKWYNFKIVLNTNTRKADIFVDGNKIGDQVDFEGTTENNVAVFRSNIGARNFGVLMFDDLKVYNEGAAPVAAPASAPKPAAAPAAPAPKNPKTGDPSSMIYGLVLASAAVTFVASRKRK